MTSIEIIDLMPLLDNNSVAPPASVENNSDDEKMIHRSNHAAAVVMTSKMTAFLAKWSISIITQKPK